jgi:hypothetical protein
MKRNLIEYPSGLSSRSEKLLLHLRDEHFHFRIGRDRLEMRG